MNESINNFATALEGQFKIDTKYTRQGVTVLGKDLAGNTLASRTLSAQQLEDDQLTNLVLADLKTTLTVLADNPNYFPNSGTGPFSGGYGN